MLNCIQLKACNKYFQALSQVLYLLQVSQYIGISTKVLPTSALHQGDPRHTQEELGRSSSTSVCPRNTEPNTNFARLIVLLQFNSKELCLYLIQAGFCFNALKFKHFFQVYKADAKRTRFFLDSPSIGPIIVL